MLQKWKLIINNWINCYFNESNTNKQNVNLESLLNIISHLRENFNLDESKSSVLAAHTVQEFILEKYSAFEFENGTVEATTEEDLYLVASLLLFFVCVNSKDVDIKNAMCSRLCGEDQEIILKFSKSLLECSPVTCRDVKAAITEACGLGMAAIDTGISQTIAETPPALRSLHGEVRRLQAALEAERFDRNYLQEELSRTNLRLEKLLKDKEQCKLDIVNLKAKISTCCGQEAEERGSETRGDSTAKLVKQLQDAEERLERTQEMLDDVTYERDTYKAKVNELKQDRDKWLSISQQESSRASELSEELETERRNVHSLKELVAELRQHNRLNGLDSSQLECDDPDASINSLHHNLSVCSEVCANVVEVQLGEERAKIVVLKQHIQNLQDQITELTQKSENEKQTYEKIVSEREDDIFNLKHRVNEEIEEKHNLKSHFNDEVSKLNNEINELEQKLKDNNEHSRLMIEQKMREIQTLQEEKLSLLQSLSDETSKLDRVIQGLKSELETEKQTKLNMKDSYENHIMKLNEKMLNRNNELVELQNNACEKSEMIESLHLELRKEKEYRDSLMDKYHDDMSQMSQQSKEIEDNLRKQMDDMTSMQQDLEQKISTLTNEADYLKTFVSGLENKCQALEEANAQLLTEINTRILKAEELEKDVENLKNTFSEDRQKLNHDLDQKHATICSLQTHLQDEINFKIELQEELQKLHTAKIALSDEMSSINATLFKAKTELKEKEKIIEVMDLCSQENKYNVEKLKIDNAKLAEEVKKVKSDIIDRENNIETIKNNFESTKKSFREELSVRDESIEQTNKKLSAEVLEKEALQKTLKDKCNDLTQLQVACEKLSQVIENNKSMIRVLEDNVEKEKQKTKQLQHNFDIETNKMFAKLNETERTIKELSSNSKKTIKNKDKEIQSLKREITNLKKAMDGSFKNANILEKEKVAFSKKLAEEISYKNIIEKEYQNQCKRLENITAEFNTAIVARNDKIKTMTSELESVKNAIEEKQGEYILLEHALSEQKKINTEVIHQKELEVIEKDKRLKDQELLNEELAEKLKKTIDERQLVIEALQKENEQLLFTIEEDNSGHEIIIKEKDRIIDELEQQLKIQSIQLESIRKDFEDLTLTWEKYKIESRDNLAIKDDEIRQLNARVMLIQAASEDITEEKNNIEELLNNEVTRLLELLDVSEMKHLDLKKEKELLLTRFEKVTAANIGVEAENAHMLEKINILANCKDELETEKLILQQQLLEEKSVRDIIEKEKEMKNEDLKKEISIVKTLLNEKECLTQQIVEEKCAKELAEREKADILDEKIKLEFKMKEEQNNTELLKNEINALIQKQVSLGDEYKNQKQNLALDLIIEKAAKDKLLKEKEILIKELETEKSAKLLAEAEKNNIHAEKLTLQQKVDKEEKDKEILKNNLKEITEKLVLLEENTNKEKEEMILELTTKRSAIDELLKEKGSLEIQLVEEKGDKDLVIKEKDEILAQKELLEQKINEEQNGKAALKNEIKNITDRHTSIEDDYVKQKEHLILELTNEKLVKEELIKKKDQLINYNESLKHDLVENTTIQEVLMSDKQLLLVEKEGFIKSLEVEKAARDEVQNEKNVLSEKLNKLNEKYTAEMDDKQQELAIITADMKRLEMDYKNQEDFNEQLASTLTTGLQKLTNDLQKEDITNEVLEKLIKTDNNISIRDKCDLVISIANTLTNEIALRKKLEKAHENTLVTEMNQMIKQKEIQIFELETEVKRLQQAANESKIDLSKQTESYTTSLDNKTREMLALKQENQSLTNDLNDVKLQLEVKVHSLKEKLVDNEHLTDKLKTSYESQIDNLNIMITKLSSYMKDKTIELENSRKEKERLQLIIEDNNQTIKTLEEEVKTSKQKLEQLITDFDSERQILKNMVTVTESVMEDQKLTLNKVITEHVKANEVLQEENMNIKKLIETEKKNFEVKLKEKDNTLQSVFKELAEIRIEKDKIEKDAELQKELLNKQLTGISEDADVQKQILNKEIMELKEERNILELKNKNLVSDINKYQQDIETTQKNEDELKIQKDTIEIELNNKLHKLQAEVDEKIENNNKLENSLKEKVQNNIELQEKVQLLNEQVKILIQEKNDLEEEKSKLETKLNEMQMKLELDKSKDNEEITKLKIHNIDLVNNIEQNKTAVTNLELLMKHEVEQNKQLREDTDKEKLHLANKCSLLQDYQNKAAKEVEDRQKEIVTLQKEIKTLISRLTICEEDLRAKDGFISRITKDKDAVISVISKELLEEKTLNEKYQKELEVKTATTNELRKNLDDINNEREALNILKKENEELIKAIGQRETFLVQSQDRILSQKQSSLAEKDLRDHHQVDNTSSDITHSSLESLKTITDLEKIINDKNRTITTLQSDVTYLKTLMAESETKLLDVTKELEVSKDNCQQLSNQLKKIVHQKNEEIAELKKQVTKMSVTENRATQIIKVSAKYQAIILKRIAEIKSNTVLKELTNFGNSNSCDNELRRSLNTGSITMEDLENFLETTDRHLKRCSEKQVTLQKERDRLAEVNRINESEIISMKKFLTELSVSYQTFSSVKDLYSQKLSRVISIQRTVRREILNMDGRITDACMCKLERGYAAVMQDLSECAMNLQRWVDRSIGRTISPEKIKQAFIADVDRTSLAPTSFQNAGLDVQLEELENSFQKLLEEVVRAQKGEGAKDPQALTVMEVRAEYEDKLNRMKAKMKQLYTDQIAVFKEKQREEIVTLERELQKTRDKLAESSRAYEEHIRGLTSELWSVGEKFLMKKDEADWLRRKNRSGSLMSLQHVHSSGLLPPQEEPARPSDTHSLRSLPVKNNTSKREGRGLHMSDEEGEVFDNRWLKELAATPRRSPRRSPRPAQRLSELQWRNSLCPPHLKSSYPAETQFAPALDEEDIKCMGTLAVGAKPQRKEVGITAYKKPGPPTPSKQAGRLSATDSELRESLRVEADPQPSRKTSTPSRIRALFRSSKTENAEGTPRSRRLSIFRKK